MSDDKSEKPEKQFFDEKTGIVHGHECPKTKKEFGQGGDGECALEALLKLPVPDLDSLKGQTATISIGGPAKVNSRAYRENWGTIFGKKATVGEA